MTQVEQSRQPLMEAHKHLCALQGAGLKNFEVLGNSFYFATKDGVICEVYLALGSRLYLYVNSVRVGSFPVESPELIAKRFEA